MRPNKFTIGFFCGLLPLVAANLYSYFSMPEYPTMDDGFVEFGVPFKLYGEGGLGGFSGIYWGGLLADVSVAACASIILGWALEKSFVHRSRLP